MKRWIPLILTILFPAAIFAASGSVTLVNEPGLPYNNTYPQNLQAYGSAQGSAGKLSAQISYSSATFASKTFTDGQQSTGSITVTSNNILGTKATDNITVPATSLILPASATAQMTIVSTTAISGVCVSITANQILNFCAGTDFAIGTASVTAVNLAAAINGVGGLVASTGGGTSTVVFASATVMGGQIGAFGNNFTIKTTNSGKISVSGANFSGGRDDILLNGYFILGGIRYKNGVHWTDSSGTSTGTALSITNFLNSFQVVAATTTSSVVFATTTVVGLAQNLTFTASPGFTIATPTFIGGQDAGNVTINGKLYTAGVNFSTGTTAQTATSLATAITASSTTNNVTASPSTNVITLKSVGVGPAVNYTLASSTQAALTLSPPVTTTSGASVGVMTGGAFASYTKGSANITVTANGFTKGLPVVYSGTPAIGGLTTGTTYFVIPVDVNTLQLATTLVNAQAGTGIVITSSAATTTSDTYTLAPQVFALGSAGGSWQVSNDGLVWTNYTVNAGNIAVSSQTFTASGVTTVVQDFGIIDYSWLRYNVTAPTTGGITLKVILGAKD